MNIYTRKVVWANWHIVILKWSVFAFGIIFGALFSDFWKPILWPLGVFAVLTSIWVTVIWISAMRGPEKAENR